jgi:hydrogenase maturation protease
MLAVAAAFVGPEADAGRAPVLVMGLGNILMEDEGVGIAVIDRLSQRYKLSDAVELLDGGTSGMALLDDLRLRERLIVVDAVRTGQPAGTIVVLKGDEVPAFLQSKISPHQLALSDVLAVLTFTDELPPDITVIGVEPASLETHLGLSGVVAGRLDALVMRVVEELGAIGYAPVSRADPPSSEFGYAAGGIES